MPEISLFYGIRVTMYYADHNPPYFHVEYARKKDMIDILNPGGRICIITFHSLEDRMVKQRFASWCEGCVCPPDFPVCVCGRKPRARLPFKVKGPSAKELEENPRSRSAKLRAVEKVGE